MRSILINSILRRRGKHSGNRQVRALRDDCALATEKGAIWIDRRYGNETGVA